MDRLSTTFAALADPTRRSILERLREGEAPVGELAEPFAISLPAVSRHLKVLAAAGLIVRGREAQWRPCRLDADPIREVAAWAAGFRGFWAGSFERLDELPIIELGQDRRSERMRQVQKIVTFLWFEDRAEEAMEFYVSLFPDSKVINVDRIPGGVVVGTFQMAGQEYMALQGGPMFKFTEAISLYVKCEDQADVDRLWSKLLEGGGQEQQCGWLKDRFGLSWQIIPDALTELMSDPDPAKSGRVMQAMLGMIKIDVEGLRRAHRGD